MDKLDIENKVKEVLADKLDISIEKIKLNSSLKDDLGMDSFGAIEAIFELEDKFKIQIPEDNISNLKTVGDICNFIFSKILTRL